MPISRSKLIGASALAATTAALVARARSHAQKIVAPLGIWRTIPTGDMRRVGVVYNPSKGGATAAVGIIERTIRANGWPAPITCTTRIDEPGGEATREVLAEGADIVIAVGGDGTVRAVATALQGSQATLAIIPLGTGNLLARNLYLPVGDVASCVNIALNGVQQPVDAIRMVTDPGSDEKTEHTFFVMSGAGFDALVMNDTTEELKARIGWLAYVRTGLRHMMGHSHMVRLKMDDEPVIETRVRSVLIANCGRLQGGLQLTDMTDLDDGNLEVIVASPRTVLEWGLLTAKVMRRTLLGAPRVEMPMIRHFVGHKVELEMLDEPQPVEVDGDPAPSASHICAHIIPAAIHVNIHPDAHRLT